MNPEQQFELWKILTYIEVIGWTAVFPVLTALCIAVWVYATESGKNWRKR